MLKSVWNMLKEQAIYVAV